MPKLEDLDTNLSDLLVNNLSDKMRVFMILHLHQKQANIALCSLYHMWVSLLDIHGWYHQFAFPLLLREIPRRLRIYES